MAGRLSRLPRPVRIALMAVAVIAIVIVGLNVADVIIKYRYNAHLEERRAYWEAKVARELPVGTPVSTARAWIAANTADEPSVGEQDRELATTLEYLPVPGVPFPCSAWMVLLHIEWDGDGRITKPAISTPGMCL
jgi:hypothetical protein